MRLRMCSFVLWTVMTGHWQCSTEGEEHEKIIPMAEFEHGPGMRNERSIEKNQPIRNGVQPDREDITSLGRIEAMMKMIEKLKALNGDDKIEDPTITVPVDYMSDNDFSEMGHYDKIIEPEGFELKPIRPETEKKVSKRKGQNSIVVKTLIFPAIVNIQLCMRKRYSPEVSSSECEEKLKDLHGTLNRLPSWYQRGRGDISAGSADTRYRPYGDKGAFSQNTDAQNGRISEKYSTHLKRYRFSKNGVDGTKLSGWRNGPRIGSSVEVEAVESVEAETVKSSTRTYELAVSPKTDIKQPSDPHMTLSDISTYRENTVETEEKYSIRKVPESQTTQLLAILLSGSNTKADQYPGSGSEIGSGSRSGSESESESKLKSKLGSSLMALKDIDKDSLLDVLLGQPLQMQTQGPHAVLKSGDSEPVINTNTNTNQPIASSQKALNGNLSVRITSAARTAILKSILKNSSRVVQLAELFRRKLGTKMFECVLGSYLCRKFQRCKIGKKTKTIEELERGLDTIYETFVELAKLLEKQLWTKLMLLIFMPEKFTTHFKFTEGNGASANILKSHREQDMQKIAPKFKELQNYLDVLGQVSGDISDLKNTTKTVSYERQIETITTTERIISSLLAAINSGKTSEVMANTGGRGGDSKFSELTTLVSKLITKHPPTMTVRSNIIQQPVIGSGLTSKIYFDFIRTTLRQQRKSWRYPRRRKVRF